MTKRKVTDRKFNELSIKEQHNEILKAIHNRLSEISISLEFIVRNSSFIDYAGFTRFQRGWTRYIDHCNRLFVIDEDDEDDEET